MDLTKENIKAIQDKMGEFEQFSPLFADEANEVMYSGVKGEITTFNLNGRDLNSLVVKSNGSLARIPLVMGAETKSVFNIGIFVAIRDYTSQNGNVFEAGKTSKVFAY